MIHHNTFSVSKKLTVKDLKGFFSKNNLLRGRRKIRPSKLQQQYNPMNALDSLLGSSITQKTFEGKKAMVAAGRPKPKLEQLIGINKHANRRFSVAKYEKYIWITGSNLKNRMYCLEVSSFFQQAYWPLG